MSTEILTPLTYNDALQIAYRLIGDEMPLRPTGSGGLVDSIVKALMAVDVASREQERTGRQAENESNALGRVAEGRSAGRSQVVAELLSALEEIAAIDPQDPQIPADGGYPFAFGWAQGIARGALAKVDAIAKARGR